MRDAPVELVPYDLDWPAAFLREQVVIIKALAPWLTCPPVHIGSTAIPGLSAKPAIDIMAPVTSLTESLPAIKAAVTIGYVYFPYQTSQMHWFCKPSPEHRTHHLHLVPINSQLWHDRLAFRDALCADQNLRDAYLSLKLRLAAKYRQDREAYTEGKSGFITKVLRDAMSK